MIFKLRCMNDNGEQVAHYEEFDRYKALVKARTICRHYREVVIKDPENENEYHISRSYD